MITNFGKSFTIFLQKINILLEIMKKLKKMDHIAQSTGLRLFLL